jgi:hypothetical protein
MQIGIHQLHDLLLIVFNRIPEIPVIKAFQVPDEAINNFGRKDAMFFINFSLEFKRFS